MDMHEAIMNTPMSELQETVMTLPFEKLMHALETAAKLSLGQDHSLTVGLGFMKASAIEIEEQDNEKVWQFVQGEIAKLTGESRKQFFMYVAISIKAVSLAQEKSN